MTTDTATSSGRTAPGRLQDKVVIVTGAARGQGEAEARLCASQGARVVLTDVLADRLDATAASIDGAIGITHDVTDPAQWQAVVAATLAAHGRIDGLVNNAAVHWIRPLADESLDDMRSLMDVNLFGAVAGMQACAPVMARTGGGSIVNISSLAGYRGYYGHSAYGATKWALRGVSRVASIEFGPLAVRVNTILPGSIETDMLPTTGDADADAARHAQLPIARTGTVDEIAYAVVYYLSEESSFTTGSELVIDGGSYAGAVPPHAR